MTNQSINEDCIIAIAHKTGLVLASNKENDAVDLSGGFISAIMSFSAELSGEIPEEVHIVCKTKKISVVAKEDFRLIGIYDNPSKFGTIGELGNLLDLFVNHFEPLLTQIFGSDDLKLDITPFKPFGQALAKIIPKYFTNTKKEDRERIEIVKEIYRIYL